jgi:hypothetical protein
VKIVPSVLAGLVAALGIWRRRITARIAVPRKMLVTEAVPPEIVVVQARIAHACQASDKFRVAWEGAVRKTADSVTARIAGARMAGRAGLIRGEAHLPLLRDLDPDHVRVAFALAVRDEVARRVDAMPHPGGFG